MWMRKQGGEIVYQITFLPGQRQCLQPRIKNNSRIKTHDEATEPKGNMSPLPSFQHQFLHTALSALTLFKTARANVNEFLFAYLFFLC